MSNTELLVAILLGVFAFVVIVIFRGRRWIGAIGWTLVAVAFIVSILSVNDQSFSLLSSTLRIAVAVVGIAMATYDYLRYERPRRRQKNAPTSLIDGLPPIRRRRRFQIRRRRSAEPRHKEQQ